LPRDKEFAKWLQAQIALQRDAIKFLDDKEHRTTKEGQIALMEMELKQIRRRK
jgi:hypothetical protein